MKYAVLLLLVCFSFPAFAHVHVVGKTAKFSAHHSKKAGKKAAHAAKSAALFLF